MLLNLLRNLKPNLIIDILLGIHKAEKDELNGKYPFKFYIYIFVLPLIFGGLCLKYYPTPTDSFNSNILQILSIVVGLLIASLVPFYEIAANKVLDDLSEVKVSDLNRVRISLMLISYSVIAFSLLLGVLGIVFCLLTNIEFELIQKLSIKGLEIGKIVTPYLKNSILYVYYVILLMSVSNLFNIIKYTNSLVVPVFEKLKNISDSDS